MFYFVFPLMENKFFRDRCEPNDDLSVFMKKKLYSYNDK